MSKEITIKSFIGKASYDSHGGYIWGEDKDGGIQMIGEVRGWGAIQNLFENPDGTIRHGAEQFQDSVGAFIAEAINEKIERDFK